MATPTLFNNGLGAPANAAPGIEAQANQNAMNSLNQALNSNAQAYGGLENQAQQQYQQNAGRVNENLVNSGLGNTTVAQTMQQAPLQTLNNALLNITGQQQGAAANIYGQQAGQEQQGGQQFANLLSSLQGQNMTGAVDQGNVQQQQYNMTPWGQRSGNTQGNQNVQGRLF
jgi:hypothetical protein